MSYNVLQSVLLSYSLLLPIFVELVSYFCRYSPLVRLLCHYGCDPAAEDDTGHNALHYALKRGSREMVEDIIDALSEPLRLDFICR